MSELKNLKGKLLVEQVEEEEFCYKCPSADLYSSWDWLTALTSRFR